MYCLAKGTLVRRENSLDYMLDTMSMIVYIGILKYIQSSVLYAKYLLSHTIELLYY